MERFTVRIEVSDGEAKAERAFVLEVDGRRTPGTLAADIERALKDAKNSKVLWPETPR